MSTTTAREPKSALYLIVFLVVMGLFSSQTADAQSKDTTKPAMAASIHQANDSTPLLTYKNFQELENMIQEIPAKYANPITNWLQQRFQLRAQEYALKPKK